MSFQPFLRFWAEPPRREPKAVVEFQPFLRFWGDVAPVAA